MKTSFWRFVVFWAWRSFWVVGGIGFLLRKNWARTLLIFGFSMAAIIWGLFMTVSFVEVSRNPFLMAGVSAGVFGLVGGALLFLSHTKMVLPHFGDKLKNRENNVKILDDEI